MTFKSIFSSKWIFFQTENKVNTSNAKIIYMKGKNKSVVKGLMETKNIKSEIYQQRMQTEKEECKHFHILFHFEF